MSFTQTPGAVPPTEGQRLVMLRRGSLSRWIKEHPRATNWILAALNVVFHLLFLMIIAVSSPAPSLIHLLLIVVFNVVWTALIFWRKRWALSLLLSSVLLDFIYSLLVGTENTYSLAGFTSWIFLYTVAAELTMRKTIIGFVSMSLPSIVTMGFLYLSKPIATGGGDSITLEEDPIAVLTLMGFSIGMMLAISLVIVMFGRFTHKNNEFDREVIERFDQTQVLAAAEERTRIAREMHDVVAHSLTVMITLADGARIVGKKNPQRAEEVLLELSNTGRSALADIRRTLGVLRDPSALNTPLIPAEGKSTDAVENLQELTDSFAATGMPVSFEHQGQNIPADNNLRLSLYRIVQESLTNALRYGRNVSMVKVELLVDLPHLWISVVNDGSAALETSSSDFKNLGSGKGLTGIRERAAFYDGSVKAGPNDRGGWTTRAHLIWKSEPASEKN